MDFLVAFPLFPRFDEKIMHQTTSFVVPDIHWPEGNFHHFMIYFIGIASHCVGGKIELQIEQNEES